MMDDTATLINNVQVLAGFGVTLLAGIVLQNVPFVRANRKWILPVITQLSTWAAALAQGHATGGPTEHTLAAGIVSVGMFSTLKNLLQYAGKWVPVIESILKAAGIGAKPAPVVVPKKK